MQTLMMYPEIPTRDARLRETMSATAAVGGLGMKAAYIMRAATSSTGLCLYNVFKPLGVRAEKAFRKVS